MTPQAKGRVKRLFQTLQDRWIVELRIRGIHTLEEAKLTLDDMTVYDCPLLRDKDQVYLTFLLTS
jgi:hypothetical protein